MLPDVRKRRLRGDCVGRDIEDFERIHRTELSRLPRVARIQSSFALRDVVNRTVPPVVFGKPSRAKKES